MRLAVTTLLFVAFAGAASAQETSTPPSALAEVYRCAELTGDSERLACYDAAAGRLRQAESTGDLVAVDRAQAETIQREAFGFSLPSLPRVFTRNAPEVEEAEVALVIERVGRRADGKPVFYMTNGQVWAQVVTVTGSRARAGGEVAIRRAALGSYLMSVEAGGPALRVRREQ